MNQGLREIRVLALDIGKVRVGVAVSDPMGLTAQPCPTLKRQPHQEFIENLAQLIEKYQVRTVVAGLPIGLKGQKGSSYHDVLSLRDEMRKRWPEVRFETCDERFTSTMAQQIVRNAPKGKKRNKGLTDQIAAQLILQHYLESHPTEGVGLNEE